MIRTAGDQRISNFLLWQCSYAELFFTQTKWPDFSVDEFYSIIDRYNERERRFGTITKDINLSTASDLAKKNINKLKMDVQK